ncbi:nitrite reductase small subunit NirD [Dyella jiangningensis]|uniref:Nitrite reductase (NAD(P)H) small subunit n=1 Tax=Dyella jiangningensis TaxID=1379159 RepID=A0A328NZJ7_9GAMM|nr:nitrite reductase small subunit NirD [Dyella jiangningensis]RAO75259.1 nitrite reductase (NAD(P)H) small subunit [Dyella jiangningensis]
MRVEDIDWTSICRLDEIVPDTGVCALVDGEQVAVFRLRSEALYAIDNIDPHSQAAVLSRGLVGSLGERIVVASPIHKQHFDLRTGECLEMPQHPVRTWQVRRDGDLVQVRRGA